MLTYSQTIFSAEQRFWLGKFTLSQNGIKLVTCGFPHSGLESMTELLHTSNEMSDNYCGHSSFILSEGFMSDKKE